MPKGPKGQYRPSDAAASGVMSMKVALGLVPEQFQKPSPSSSKKKDTEGLKGKSAKKNR